MRRVAPNSADFRGLGAVWRGKAPKSAVYYVRMYVGIILLLEFGRGLAPDSAEKRGLARESAKKRKKSAVLAQFFYNRM